MLDATTTSPMETGAKPPAMPAQSTRSNAPRARSADVAAADAAGPTPQIVSDTPSIADATAGSSASRSAATAVTIRIRATGQPLVTVTLATHEPGELVPVPAVTSR
jgi:hypothetical protein